MVSQSLLLDVSLQPRISRRAFLNWSSTGLGAMALAELLGREARAADSSRWAGAARPLPLPAKAKRVIYLYMAGGPSQLESFDFKPKLAAMDGQPMPESFTKGQPIAQLTGSKLICMAPQFSFSKVGEAGQEITELFPSLRTIADELCIIRSMRSEEINHDPAHAFMNTGTNLPGRPSLGSWLWYGLGSENSDLPGFVVLSSLSQPAPVLLPVPSQNWHSGLLPSRFQGIQVSSQGDPVLYLKSPPGISVEREQDFVKTVQSLNQVQNRLVNDPEIATRIAQYEMAFHMQTAVPELTDFSQEPREVLELYGAKPGDGSFASNCLLARRLAERGVRFTQIVHREWDHHVGLKKNIKITASDVDRPSAALVKDLKRRGMLDDTLVIWGGEFGRTPMAQGNGRDHHIKGFSIWLAGGGVKGGITHGATDELGYNAIENPVDVHDLHATILHLLGIDHKRLTYRFQGRDFRLTDVAGKVVRKILT